MTLTEFKAWFSGYTEDMDRPPTAKQWKRIKKVVADVDRWGWSYTGVPLPDYSTVPLTGTGIGPNTSCTLTIDAMYAAGKAEAKEFYDA